MHILEIIIGGLINKQNLKLRNIIKYMNSGMTHKDWIKSQFDKKRKKENYRNVLIHTSFIETIVKKSAGSSNFDCAIKILKADTKNKNEPLKEIDDLRKKRNAIIHEILNNKTFKVEDDINGVVKTMKALLKQIYSNSHLIDVYLQKNFEISSWKIF